MKLGIIKGTATRFQLYNYSALSIDQPRSVTFIGGFFSASTHLFAFGSRAPAPIYTEPAPHHSPARVRSQRHRNISFERVRSQVAGASWSSRSHSRPYMFIYTLTRTIRLNPGSGYKLIKAPNAIGSLLGRESDHIAVVGRVPKLARCSSHHIDGTQAMEAA